MPAAPIRFALRLRIPGWCRTPHLAVADQAIDVGQVSSNGYASIEREWRTGDQVTLSLPMPVERIRAHPRLTHNADCVALQRGPIVYCVEEVDNGAELGALRLPKNTGLQALFDEQLFGGGIQDRGAAERVRASNGELYSTAEPMVEATTIRAVPYAFWANRGEGEMRVWVKET